MPLPPGARDRSWLGGRTRRDSNLLVKDQRSGQFVFDFILYVGQGAENLPIPGENPSFASLLPLFTELLGKQL